MAYFKVFTAAATFTAPAAGDYKIICIGAGGDGAAVVNGPTAIGMCGAVAETVVTLAAGDTVSCTFAGGTSAFGTHLSAAKGSTFVPIGYIWRGDSGYARGGDGGYTLDGVYGGNGEEYIGSAVTPAVKNGGAAGQTGHGFGAGGGAYLGTGNYTSSNRYGASNGAGGAIIVAGM